MEFVLLLLVNDTQEDKQAKKEEEEKDEDEEGTVDKYKKITASVNLNEFTLQLFRKEPKLVFTLLYMIYEVPLNEQK